jgi:molybdate transport system ATP-binding protein
VSLAIALRHRFPGRQIDVSFSAASPGVTALFGPSGAGKSTVIAAVAGLLRPDMCRVDVDGRVLADTDAGIWLPPERRRVGLVFQDARLFPHMSVTGNLRYGLRRAHRAGGRAAIGFDEIVALLGIEPLLGRRPRTLSGGEQQRVAIGRALLAQPEILLMDEPLAGLDDARKADILPFLARLKSALKLPLLYVTHAMDEVIRLADTLVLIEAGRVAAAGPLNDILARGDLAPGLRDDAGSVLTMRVRAHDTARRLTRLDSAGLVVWVPLLAALPGSDVRIRVPAREVILSRGQPDEISVQNIVAGRVRKITEDAPRHAALVEVAVGGDVLLARVTPDAVRRLDLVAGGDVVAMFKSVGVEVVG